jgi:CubicO group peptidase (beta-lactamase class C family)
VLAGLLYSSASHGDMDNLEILMKYNPNLEWKSAEGLTAWQQANVNGRADVAELLVQNGALVENKFPAVKDYIDLYIKNVIKEETTGFAVLVAEDGDIIFRKGYGYADIKEKIPVTSDTKFRIGSITKQFVASGILKLKEQGKLSVDDKLSKYMPDFPRGDEVTIHHLLTHTSGIHSFTNRPEFVDYVTKKIDAKTLVDSIKSWDFDFDPGEELIYNNSGYFLLGEIIEKVTGKWYGDYLQEVFFKPLGMSNTGIYANEQPPKNMALGYTVKNEKYTPALDWNMSWAGGAGSMYSTVGDLFKWNEALYDGKVLSEESLEAAHTPVKLNNGELPAFGKYGYGWMISDFRGTTEIAHGGGLHGFISYLSRIKEEDLTIVTLTNSTPTMDGLNPNTTSAVFAQYVLWEKLDNKKSNKTVEIDKNKLNDFVGRYDYGNSMVLTVTQADDKLFAQMSGQNQFELFPSAEDEFYWKVVEAKIQFKRDGTGKVVHGIHFQGGRELKVLKLPELVSLEINADKIKPFVGNYKFNDDFMIEVTFTDGHLFVQGTGQPKFELFRVEADKYMPKEIMLAIRFIEEEGSYKIEMDQGSTKTIIEKVE